jgi:hypothetical protein
MDQLGPHDRISDEVLKALDGKVLPVTIEEKDGTKRAVGTATLSADGKGLKIESTITDPGIAKLLAPDLQHYNIFADRKKDGNADR